MRRSKNMLLCLAVMALFVITSCAAKGTTFTSVWKDDNYQGGKVKSVLIIGVSKKPDVRKMFEDEFVKDLKAMGVEGLASHTVLPADRMLEKGSILDVVHKRDIQSVILTRLIKREDAIDNVPAEHKQDINTQYVRSYNYSQNRGYLLQDEAVSLETNLYDVATEKLVWSALSETFTRGTDDEIIKGFILKVTENLKKTGLL